MNRKQLRSHLYDKQAGHCWYCGKTIDIAKSELEHQTSLFRGGLSNEENIVLACLKCNRRKGPLTLEGYRAKLIKHHTPIKLDYRYLILGKNDYDNRLLIYGPAPTVTFWGESENFEVMVKQNF